MRIKCNFVHKTADNAAQFAIVTRGAAQQDDDRVMTSDKLILVSDNDDL